jgi:hypothetical protein
MEPAVGVIEVGVTSTYSPMPVATSVDISRTFDNP